MFDAPGTEKGVEMSRNLIRCVDDEVHSDDDRYIQALLTRSHTFEVNNLNQVAMTRRRNKLKDRKVPDTSMIPLKDDTEEMITYCQTLVKESMYINLLIGEMARLVTKGMQNLLPQTLPLMMIYNEDNGKWKVCKKCHNHPCTYESVRFVYHTEDDQKCEPSVTDTLQTDHVELRASNDADPTTLQRIFPLEQFTMPDSSDMALIIVPYKSAALKHTAITAATQLLTKQLLGDVI